MSAPTPLAKMPRPALFALVGMVVALLSALTFGELVWYWGRSYALAAQTAAPTEPPATTPPALVAGPRLAVSAAAVAVYPGGKNTFGVRVARDGFDGAVLVRFDAPAGPRAAEITVPAGETIGKAEVVVPPDVRPGNFTLTATATANTDESVLTASAPVRVTVRPLPVPPARLGVSASPVVPVYQKGKNTFGVRVARDGFDDPVTVTFDGPPPGVKIPPVVVAAGKLEATAELTAEAGARIGEAKVMVTARAAPRGVATAATAELAVAVLDPSKGPIDIVLVLDCTGSMKKSVDGLCRSFPAFASELQARFDVRFGLVGFRDTTLGQPLEVPLIGGERMSPDARSLVAAVRGVRLGGGGGDGESSLDGLAEAADYPLRESASRVLLLVTDGPPKRADGRMRGAETTMKYLNTKRIDQLHVVSLPPFRRAFEPLWEGGPKGRYFDLKGAIERNEFDKLLAELGKEIAGNVPTRAEAKPDPAATVPIPVLPDPTPVKPPDPPASREPDEPQFGPAELSAPEPKGAPADQPAPLRKALVLTLWAATVAGLTTLLLSLAQLVLLPGSRSPGAVAAAQSGGLVVGLGAGALGYIALDALGVPVLARLGAGGLFGLFGGLTVPLVEDFFARDEPEALDPDAEDPEEVGEPLPAPPPLPVPARAPLLDLDLPTVEAYPTAKPPPVPARAPLLDLDLPTVEAYSAAPAPSPAAPPAPVPVHKPNITAAPKPGDGCPKCGRKIPGAAGERYCMLCDNTF